MSKLKEVKVEFQKQYNFVELKKYQLYRAIDNVFGRNQIKAYDDKAGFELSMHNAPVNCSLELSQTPDKSFGPTGKLKVFSNK